jgi:hypothetical protein
MDSVSLGDDVDLTGRQISRFSYKGAEQPVGTWAEAYQRILRILHQQDESVLTSLAFSDDENEDLAMHIVTNPNKLSGSAEIAEGIYLWTGISTKYKISNLLKFFKLFDADPDDLIFYLKDENKESAGKSENERHELRRRYWEYALPYIQEENRERGCYKEAFDLLYSHKAEIEKALNRELDWERADEKKFSKVSLTITNVSITEESDWKMMARFHAEWSKALCDSMLPYLEGKYK